MSQKLKNKLAEIVGIIDYTISDEEFEKISSSLLRISPQDVTVSELQRIVKDVTKHDNFILNEAVDNSDINQLIEAIRRLIRNR